LATTVKVEVEPPAAEIDGAESCNAMLATTGLKVSATVFVVFATTVSGALPVESALPAPPCWSLNVTETVSLPTGAAIVPPHVAVQLTTVELAGLLPAGATLSVADAVDAET
jgi:hypothetical protein